MAKQKKTDKELMILDNMNKDQLRIDFDFNNSFSLSSIGTGVAFFIASTTQTGISREILFWLPITFGVTGFLILKTRVRDVYLRLLREYD